MAADAEDTIAPAILSYITSNTYPTSETTSSATLTPSTLSTLTQSLHEAQETIKSEIRVNSRAASGDIDTWISRAKDLQKDILKSRDVAREIVQEAERTRQLKVEVEDKRKKVTLLEGEVGFLDRVKDRLERARQVKGVLEVVQDALARGEIVQSLKALNEAEQGVSELQVGGESAVGVVFRRRVEGLKEELRQRIQAGWMEKIIVHAEDRSVTITSGLEDLITAAKGLGLFDGLIAEFAKRFEKAIVRPRMSADRDGRTPSIHASAERLICSDSNEESSLEDLIKDLGTVLSFLADRLPPQVSGPLSDLLLPTISSKLEEEWLQPAIPLELSEMPAFQEVLGAVTSFAEKIEQLGWNGSQPLRDWTQGSARYWLTKRREALLGDVRNLVFTGLRETKTVERVETQMVNNDDELRQGDEGGDEDWDTAWDEPDENNDPSSQAAQPSTTSATTTTTTTEDDDDTSAWDLDDDGEPAKEGGNDEEDAWGWGDGDKATPAQPSNTPAPTHAPPLVNGQQAPTKSSQREMTLRETFTVTGVPDGILELLQRVITDAGTLGGPEYASTPIAPVAPALYTLPTLALAIYRATAPTAYNKLSTGNMLIYNDANRLSDQLRSWQASQPSASRLRLDNDVKALDEFAKRAYSAEMESQRTILTDLLDGAQGFSTCTAEPYKSECSSAVEQTTHRLRDVHQEWTSILSSSALLQSVGSLLSTITSKMIREIEDLPDIGEAESKQLKSFCDHVSSVKDLFEQTSPDGQVRDMTFIYCPNWLKFQYLAEIMESSLADIRYMWKEGELSLEFGGEEVVGLVEALFAESGLRRQAIQDVRRGGRR